VSLGLHNLDPELTKTDAQKQREREDKAVRLDNWSHIDIHRWSDYPEVDALVEYVFALMTSLEGFTGKSNVRKRHIKVILVNLYSNYLEDSARFTGYFRMVSKYRRRGRYNRLGISKSTIKVVDDFLALGLIEHVKGHYAREGKRQSHVSRMKAESNLIRMFKAYGWHELMVGKAANTESIILRLRSGINGPQVDLDYRDTDETRKMRKGLCRYNNLLRRTFVDIPEFPREGVLSSSRSRMVKINRTNKFVRRVFNNGSWEDGGRFYGPWWQNVPKLWREKIRINDEQTIEWDYSGLHIILLYALKGLNYWEVDSRDPYKLAGGEQEESLRALLKIVLLVVVNSKDIKEALKGINWHIHQTVEQHIWIKEEQIEIKDVVNEFVERHKPIEEYFFSAMGVRLQYLDSVIAEKVIKELTLRNIPCLAIHDSFITTRQEEQYLEEAMEMAIEEGVVEIVGTEVTNKMKRNLLSSEVIPWKRLKRLHGPKQDRRLLDKYWEEQREWVIGLENGKFPEYRERLARHQSYSWEEVYYQ